MEWRGNKVGCLHNDKVTAGKCSGKTAGGTLIPSYKKIPLNRWKNIEFCVKRAEAITFKAGTTACEADSVECGCHCVKGTTCPITKWKILKEGDTVPAELTHKLVKWSDERTTASDWNMHYDLGDTKANDPFWVMPEVELYGTSCINPLKHPKDPKFHYPLMNVIGKGCGVLKADTTYAEVSDS